MNRRRPALAALAAAMAAAATPAMAGSHQGWQTTADIGEIGLVSLALGKSAAERDWQGVRQFGLTEGVTLGLTTGLKYALPEERPNHADNKSFPSGHTSASFAAAGYLTKRYGWEWGLPATLAAGLVGLARVESKDHHWYDVVAGAALGEATAWIFTTPHDSKVSFLPWADTHGAGFYMSAKF